MLLAVVGAVEQHDRGLLIEILELLVAQAPALRERACEPQLAGLPFSEGSPDALGDERSPGP
jgi:hypothetical protein